MNTLLLANKISSDCILKYRCAVIENKKKYLKKIFLSVWQWTGHGLVNELLR